MPEETMIVTATPISPSGVNSGPSRPGGSLVTGISPGPAITFPSGNGIIIVLQNEPLDGKQHTLSSISTTDGEIPYDGWVFVETSGRRLLTDEGDISFVLGQIRDVGDSWARNGIDLVLGIINTYDSRVNHH